MAGEAVEMKLYNAASKGDVTTLVHLLEEHPYLVHGVSFPCSRNLLHIAAMHGQTSIVEQLLKLNPQLACISDSQESSPLHIAAARGHVEIASKLLAVAPEMCWWRDKQGMNPVNVAAMNGHVEIVEILLLENSTPAMERLHRGQTVLHLCVKHGQLRALKVLVEKMGDLVCTKDDDGDTLLHWAVRCNQLETVRYLVGIEGIKHHKRNGMGKTALQILHESPPNTINYLEMKMMLTNVSDLSFFQVIPREMSKTIMVVVILIATMAFQSATNPAGGVWDDDLDDGKSSHKAGEAVMASTHPVNYMTIMRANTTAFICSLSAMYLFTTRLHINNLFFTLASWMAMLAAQLSITITYLASVDMVTPDELMYSPGNTILWVVMLVLYGFGLISMCGSFVSQLHRSWESERGRQLDLAADAFPQPIFYWIFQKLETWGGLRIVQR